MDMGAAFGPLFILAVVVFVLIMLWGNGKADDE